MPKPLTVCLWLCCPVSKFFRTIFLDSIYICIAAKSLQSCPTLCDPIDGSPPGSPIPGLLQARTLEWVAISFSNAWKCNVKLKSLSCVWLLATPWTAAYQAPLSMGRTRIQYLSFSFWLTSLCIRGSRFIHLIRTDSKAFLFMAE